MNTEQLNQQFEPIYRANPDAVKSYMEIIADSVCVAIKGQTGVFTEETLFKQIRQSIPDAADLGICSMLADGITRKIIAQSVEILSGPGSDADTELRMLGEIAKTMEKRGLETPGEAIAYLHRQQIN